MWYFFSSIRTIVEPPFSVSESVFPPDKPTECLMTRRRWASSSDSFLFSISVRWSMIWCKENILHKLSIVAILFSNLLVFNSDHLMDSTIWPDSITYKTKLCGNNKPIRFQIFQLSRSFNKHSQRDCIECQSLNSLQLKIILHHSKRKRFLEPKQATLVLRPLLMNYTSSHPHRSNLQRETKWTHSPLKFEEEAGAQGHLDGRVPWP